MARTKKKRWSYSTGERGRNRVWVFEHSSGLLILEFTTSTPTRTRDSREGRTRDSREPEEPQRV